MRKTPRPIFIALLAFMAICIYLTSCTKTGSQGPVGLTGAAGPQGPQGNANVWVDTFTLVNSDWLWESSYTFSFDANSGSGYATRYYIRGFSKITQGILDTGEVLVYFTADPLTYDWQPLNYTFANGDQYYLNIFFQPSPSQVELDFFFTPNGTTATLPNNNALRTFDIATYRFKIVAVSGTISTGMKHAGVNTRNYESVSTYLGM
jgi:hypothetical protein